MSTVYIDKDEWTPALENLLGKLDEPQRIKFFGDLGKKIVAKTKMRMLHSQGYSDAVQYRKLKIKWRYHGSKDRVANAANLRKVKKGQARLVKGDWIRSQGVYETRVRFTDKTKVTNQTKPLIDTGGLLNSWSVLRVFRGGVIVGNTRPANKMKAAYNDDRGRWDWGRESIGEVVAEFEEYMDKELFD